MTLNVLTVLPSHCTLLCNFLAASTPAGLTLGRSLHACPGLYGLPHFCFQHCLAGHISVQHGPNIGYSSFGVWRKVSHIVCGVLAACIIYVTVKELHQCISVLASRGVMAKKADLSELFV